MQACHHNWLPSAQPLSVATLRLPWPSDSRRNPSLPVTSDLDVGNRLRTLTTLPLTSSLTKGFVHVRSNRHHLVNTPFHQQHPGSIAPIISAHPKELVLLIPPIKPPCTTPSTLTPVHNTYPLSSSQSHQPPPQTSSTCCQWSMLPPSNYDFPSCLDLPAWHPANNWSYIFTAAWPPPPPFWFM